MKHQDKRAGVEGNSDPRSQEAAPNAVREQDLEGPAYAGARPDESDQPAGEVAGDEGDGQSDNNDPNR